MPVDILYGSARLRDELAAGARSAEIAASWQAEIQPFLKIREKFLLYS
jgi:uncharacterized protein YbbC (DUF1343 family)